MPDNYEDLRGDELTQRWQQRLGAERIAAMSKVAITVVPTDEQDDRLAETLLGQERDLFMHRVNLERYETILTNGATGELREAIARLLLQTLDRISDVTAILEALTPQLPDAARLTAALGRIRTREQSPRTP